MATNSCSILLRLDSAQRAKAAGIICVIGAVILGGAGIDILTFDMPTSARTGMSGSWDPVKLMWVGTLCLVTSLIIALNARLIFRWASPQHALASR